MNAVAFAKPQLLPEDSASYGDGSIALGPSNTFVTSPAVQQIAERALAYLEFWLCRPFLGACRHREDDAGFPRRRTARESRHSASWRSRVRQFRSDRT